jgi:hypothetical protein
MGVGPEIWQIFADLERWNAMSADMIGAIDSMGHGGSVNRRCLGRG